MTTVAWDGKTLAADRQGTNNGLKQRVTKLRRLSDGSLAGISGDLGGALLAIDYIEGGAKPKWEGDEWPVILVIRPDKTIWRYEKLLVPLRMEEEFHACGTGRDYALAAMACGKTAVEAVEIAARFDADTGLGIDTLGFDMPKTGTAPENTVIDPQTIREIETADAWYLEKMRTTEPLRPAAPATTGTAKSHTDHPSRVWDRTCLACTDTQSAYDRVDNDYERKGD